MVRRSSKALLAEYNRKRDFTKTGEPAGEVVPPTGKRIFIVQKHAATRLHWDFRLEINGVLKSWAVTKGPSSDPDIKRLAVRTEDHPMAYADFEGTIPKGEYGGGSVMLWDSGTWDVVAGKDVGDVEKGHLHFTLNGTRMKGEWLLVRMKPRAGEKRENWLLRKVEDRHALPGDTLVEQGLTSVLTGRSMAQIAGDPGAEHSLEGKRGAAFAREMASAARHNKTAPERARKRQRTPHSAQPRFRAPQLATLVNAVPAGNGWLHEIKFDGYRAMISASGNKVSVFTRSGKDWTDKFAPLVRAMAGLDLPSCLIDGEIVAYDAQGNPDFSTLQGVLKRGHGSQAETDRLAFHGFDLIELNGDDLADVPLIERKERLAALLDHAVPPIHVADHVIGLGEKLHRQMCDAGQEGIISKRIDSRYREGRGRNWVKVKCTRRQEFVIVGWSKSSARNRPFASIVLAQHEGGSLVYKGKVGTGFDEATLADLAGKFARIERKSPPVEVARPEARGVSWITPKLVAEIAFAEFTADGHIRHGSFLGLRSDKPAREVVPEQPVKAHPPEPAFPITNRDRVIFPDDGYTKGQLADYYAALAPLMLPSLAQRPISLVRCPQGRARKCFFQKHDSGSFGEEVHHVPIREKDGGVEDYLYVETAAGILACVQMGTIEFHGWCSRTDEVEYPDRMIFDLDPDEGLDFADVRQAALDIRARLADLGLASFAMLSGGKGVHVVVPLSRGHSWEAHKDFSRRFAEAMSLAEPERFIATMSKAKRKGKIFIDWLRNQRGSTAIMPYSVRARPGAPVAVPISWNELPSIENAHIFAMPDIETLLERARGKALAGWGMAEQPLPDI